jgi:hypothetical protein
MWICFLSNTPPITLIGLLYLQVPRLRPLVLMSNITVKRSKKQRWKLLRGTTEVLGKKKTVPSPLSTSNPICIGLGSNSAFRRVKLIQRISGQSCVTNSWYAQPRSSIENMTLVHRGIANKMQQCIKIYYSIFIWSSTRFGRHAAHHQEPRTALAASGFAYVAGCWTCSCWILSARNVLIFI